VRMQGRWLRPYVFVIIRLFLGGTFLAQSIRAFTMQPDFLRLVSESPLFTWGIAPSFFYPEYFLLLVALFDAIIALLLFTGIAPRTVALHGLLWILLVMTNSIVVGRLIETADSVGYLGGLTALILWDRDKPRS
ncbi:MAG: hypothetical protein Q7S15_01205, partial [bacterium]|nr:hypothetical protein [bacterium]